MTAATRQSRLSREGYYHLGVVVFVLAGAWIHQISLLFIVGGLMLGPLLFSWPAVVFALRRVRVVRKHPPTVAAGELLVVSLEVQNKQRLIASRAIELEDQLFRVQGAAKTPSAKPAAKASLLVDKVGPGEVVSRSYRGPAPERGVYQFGRMRASTQFPLGLMRGSLTIDQPSTLVVFPKLGTLTPAWRSLHQTSHAGQRQLHPRQSSSEADFYAMRDWRTGDSNRWIHWPTSARRGSLVVRQFEQKRHADLVLLADLWLPSQPGEADHRRLELAIGFLATAAAETCHSGGDRLNLAIVGRETWEIGGAASSGMLHEILHQLAVTEGGGGEEIGAWVRNWPAPSASGQTALLVTTRQLNLADLLHQGSDQDPFAEDPPSGAVLRWQVLQAGADSLATYFQTDEPFALKPEFVTA